MSYLVASPRTVEVSCSNSNRRVVAPLPSIILPEPATTMTTTPRSSPQRQQPAASIVWRPSCCVAAHAFHPQQPGCRYALPSCSCVITAPHPSQTVLRRRRRQPSGALEQAGEWPPPPPCLQVLGPRTRPPHLTRGHGRVTGPPCLQREGQADNEEGMQGIVRLEGVRFLWWISTSVAVRIACGKPT